MPGNITIFLVNHLSLNLCGRWLIYWAERSLIIRVFPARRCDNLLTYLIHYDSIFIIKIHTYKKGDITYPLRWRYKCERHGIIYVKYVNLRSISNFYFKKWPWGRKRNYELMRMSKNKSNFICVVKNLLKLIAWVSEFLLLTS